MMESRVATAKARQRFIHRVATVIALVFMLLLAAAQFAKNGASGLGDAKDGAGRYEQDQLSAANR